ncbi:hypothetical protein EDC55_12710 [Allofrancisella inopinata]|uniref:Uncharacterized protein n=1 Tax=Allofrancisella inopinata TaxID=1085647 RepID=A0AAE7CPZ5_9GAMM|nr:hypothetical protein [Allofrancisella inopinata]QIV95340.1 hypothetical protein E4K63_00190 [Allofrancisella inopinata]TDT67005.1 hypothetical protein EDC55_12710 [Allofrancisella inopinata]
MSNNTIHLIGEYHNKGLNAFEDPTKLLAICVKHDIKTVFIEFLVHHDCMTFYVDNKEEIQTNEKPVQINNYSMRPRGPMSINDRRLKNKLIKIIKNNQKQNHRMQQEILTSFNAEELENVDGFLMDAFFGSSIARGKYKSFTGHLCFKQMIECVKFLIDNGITIIGIEDLYSHQSNNDSNGAGDDRLEKGNIAAAKIINNHLKNESDTTLLAIYGILHLTDREEIPVQKYLKDAGHKVNLYYSFANKPQECVLLSEMKYWDDLLENLPDFSLSQQRQIHLQDTAKMASHSELIEDVVNASKLRQAMVVDQEDEDYWGKFQELQTIVSEATKNLTKRDRIASAVNMTQLCNIVAQRRSGSGGTNSMKAMAKLLNDYTYKKLKFAMGFAMHEKVRQRDIRCYARHGSTLYKYEQQNRGKAGNFHKELQTLFAFKE